MTGGRAAVVVPGLQYSADGPLLMYAGLAVERRGGWVRRINWTVREFGGGEDEHAWVASWVSEAVDAVEATAGAAASLLIGKSLASLAAPVAADRGLPAVWPTPMLTDEPAVAALRRAVAPCLLMGGRLTRCGMAGSRGRSRRTSWRSTGPITECSSLGVWRNPPWFSAR